MKREREEPSLIDHSVAQEKVEDEQNNVEDPEDAESREEDEEQYFGKRQKMDDPEAQKVKKEQYVSILRQRILAKLHHIVNPNSIHYDEQNFTINFDLQNKPQTIFLTNSFLQWVKLGDTNDENAQSSYLDSVVNSFQEVEVPQSFDEVKNKIFPKMQIRVTKTILQIQRQLIEKAKSQHQNNQSDQSHHHEGELPMKPVADYYGIDLVLDTPNEFLQITLSDLTKWNKTYEEVYEIAMNNLRQCRIPWDELSPGVFSASAGPTYEAPSILAAPEFLQILNVKGDIVVLPITKTLILVTGTEEEDAFDSILEVSANNDSDPLFFSGIMLTYKDNQWKEYELPKDHELYSDFKFFRLHTLSMWYKMQQEYIEKLKEPGLLVAPFNAVSSPDDGSPLMTAKWTKGTLTLLPKVDLIEFEVPPTSEPKASSDNAFIIPAQPESFSCHWADVLRIMGDNFFQADPFYYPPLFKLAPEQYPSDDQLRQLREVQIDV